MRQGGAGSAHELVINHGQPWGFPLQEIEIRVHLWPTFIPGAGHLWIVDHAGEVLDALVPTG